MGRIERAKGEAPKGRPRDGARHSDGRGVDLVSGMAALGVLLVGAALPCAATLVSVLVAIPLVARCLPRGNRKTFVASCLLALVGLGLIFLPMLATVGHRMPGSHCKSNLKQLGLALILYRDNEGGGTAFPAHDGADFLLATYAAGVHDDPTLYLCPATADTRERGMGCLLTLRTVEHDDNADGALLRLGDTPARACSYAGRRNRHQSRYPGLFTTRGASETPIGSDDSEGLSAFNHEHACMILFADGHVEEVSLEEARMQGVTRVGQDGTLLEPLAN